MESPPINSFTMVFACIKAYIPPIYIHLFKSEESENGIENINNNIIETMIWRKSREKIFFNQELKNQLVLEKIKDKNAKGVRRIKTLIRIYLKE